MSIVITLNRGPVDREAFNSLKSEFLKMASITFLEAERRANEFYRRRTHPSQ